MTQQAWYLRTNAFRSAPPVAHVLLGRYAARCRAKTKRFNETWIADRDRFRFEGMSPPDRLSAALRRSDGSRQEAATGSRAHCCGGKACRSLRPCAWRAASDSWARPWPRSRMLTCCRKIGARGLAQREYRIIDLSPAGFSAPGKRGGVSPRGLKIPTIGARGRARDRPRICGMNALAGARIRKGPEETPREGRFPQSRRSLQVSPVAAYVLAETDLVASSPRWCAPARRAAASRCRRGRGRRGQRDSPRRRRRADERPLARPSSSEPWRITPGLLRTHASPRCWRSCALPSSGAARVATQRGLSGGRGAASQPAARRAAT